VTVPSADPPLRWTFVVPGLPRPAGGLFAVYELANALAQDGRDAVQIAHLPTGETTLRSAADVPWFAFHESIEHHFLAGLDPTLLPAADVVVYTVMAVQLGTAPEAGEAGRRLVEQLQAPTSPAGLPILFVQALGVFPEATELRSLQGAGPKVCVAGWIAENLVRGGLARHDVIHIPNGLDHRTFAVRVPISGRAPRVAMNHNPHPLKNMGAGIEALARLATEQAVPSVLFGSRRPTDSMPTGMAFLDSPSQAVLAESVYNGASLYLQPSTVEGFGLCALEAMACGCALVTPANGGSDDYAIDDETAVICESDAEAMTEALAGLVRDDARRVRIATNGVAHAARFRWPAGAARLREVAVAYCADPPRHRGGLVTTLDPSVRELVRPPGA
jgi:glycosyltransferase involved in cell wall biosynthesis